MPVILRSFVAERATKDLMLDVGASDPSRDGHTMARFGMTEGAAL